MTDNFKILAKALMLQIRKFKINKAYTEIFPSVYELLTFFHPCF